MDQEFAQKESVNELSDARIIEEQIIAAQPKIEIQPAPNIKHTIIVGLIAVLILGSTIYFIFVKPEILLFKFLREDNITSNQPTPTFSPVVSNIADISDPQIDKDIQALNTKITGLDTDFNNIDYGLNDSSVDTEE